MPLPFELLRLNIIDGLTPNGIINCDHAIGGRVTRYLWAHR